MANERVCPEEKSTRAPRRSQRQIRACHWQVFASICSKLPIRQIFVIRWTGLYGEKDESWRKDYDYLRREALGER